MQEACTINRSTRHPARRVDPADRPRALQGAGGHAAVHGARGRPGGTTQTLLAEPLRERRQCPIPLALLDPAAADLKTTDLLVAADCTPFAYPGILEDLLSGKIPVVRRPPLDQDLEGEVEKIAEVFPRHAIRSVTVVRMEVPCCGGVRAVVDRALQRAGVPVPIAERIDTIVRPRVRCGSPPAPPAPAARTAGRACTPAGRPRDTPASSWWECS